MMYIESKFHIDYYLYGLGHSMLLDSVILMLLPASYLEKYHAKA